MKIKEGRDYLTLSEVVIVIRDGNLQISDAGSTLTLTLQDWKKLVKFAERNLSKLREKNGGKA